VDERRDSVTTGS